MGGWTIDCSVTCRQSIHAHAYWQALRFIFTFCRLNRLQMSPDLRCRSKWPPLSWRTRVVATCGSGAAHLSEFRCFAKRSQLKKRKTVLAPPPNIETGTISKTVLAKRKALCSESLSHQACRADLELQQLSSGSQSRMHPLLREMKFWIRFLVFLRSLLHTQNKVSKSIRVQDMHKGLVWQIHYVQLIPALAV